MPQAWQVAGLTAPLHLGVLSMQAGPVEEGPLRAVYRVDYRLAGGRRYTVDLTLQHNETYLGIDETLEGFRSADEPHLRVDFTALNPISWGRSMSNGRSPVDPQLGWPWLLRTLRR